MANGKRFDMRQISVAHRSLPLGTKVKIVNLRNRKSVVAFVSDRGPYVRGRSLDLSWGAAKKLDAVHDGVIPVEVQIKI
jgi:rare lipoprotein A